MVKEPADGPAVFVLWGEHFEEAAASLFVTGLRAAGLRVRLVGLAHAPVGGAHGLTLVPDLTLSEALAFVEQISVLVLPCDSRGARQLTDDPRAAHLLQEAGIAGAMILIGSLSRRRRAALNQRLPGLRDARTYPPHEQLVPYVRALAARLVAG